MSERDPSRGVALLSTEALREALILDLSDWFDSEEGLVAFVLELQPIKGSYEVVQMAQNHGGDLSGFWTVGVKDWLSRDETGERLSELRRVARTLYPDRGMPGTVRP